jgi:integrase
VAVAALVELRRRSDGKGPVIRNLSGTPLEGARHWFEKAVALADVPDFRWHDLRHTFASRLAMAGAGIASIQRALGHKSISMTMRYAHLTEDFMQDVVERLVRPPRTEEAAGYSQTDTARGPAPADLPAGVH